HRVINRSSILE
ncbi:hypothetical protein A2U01_0110690, partial [Trifolium medium]|nr:hypothetical protein [Trifolium medium]